MLCEASEITIIYVPLLWTIGAIFPQCLLFAAYQALLTIIGHEFTIKYH